MASSSTGASTLSDPSEFAYSTAPYTDPAAAAAPAPCFPVPFHLQKHDASAQQPAEYLFQNPYSLSQFPHPAKGPQQLYPSVHVPPTPAPTPLPAAGVYSIPQYQQAQQLFQRDAQTITPEALESVKAALASSEVENKAEKKKKAVPRKAAGHTWEDPTLADWPESKYVGNRPIKLRKSNWKERTDQEAMERQKHHSQKKPKLLKKGILHK